MERINKSNIGKIILTQILFIKSTSYSSSVEIYMNRSEILKSENNQKYPIQGVK